jgi:hypothetical protein
LNKKSIVVRGNIVKRIIDIWVKIKKALTPEPEEPKYIQGNTYWGLPPLKSKNESLQEIERNARDCVVEEK